MEATSRRTLHLKPPPPELRVLRVRTLQTLSSPQLKDLVRRAVPAALPCVDARVFYRELGARIGEPGLGVFVGYQGDHAKAFGVALLPQSCMMMAPQVALVYSDGMPAIGRRLGARMREWLLEGGYKEALTCNMIARRSDRAFMVGLRHFGEPERVGSLIRFRF